MNLVKWDPFREVNALRNEWSRLFPAIANGGGTATPEGWMTAVDIVEDEKTIKVRAELPGLDKKDVDVSIEDGVLTIKGERRLERDEKKENYRRIERSYGSFFRSFDLPETVDQKNVGAQYNNGVLEVTLQKTQAAKPQQVKIPVS